MRPLLSALGWIVLLVVAGTPAPAVGTGLPEAAWSASDPLSIPYSERRRWFEAGNLTPDPSFEFGEDDGFPSGWQKVGAAAEWIDRRTAPGSPADVSDGERAVRIRRASAAETDSAEGILSDFIPVIPGNYDFTYDVRLQDVSSPGRRLGMRLGDAVTVRLLFFDRDRAPLDARDTNPAGGTTIDPGEKSYPFAPYWSIDEFPWATVRARACNYPYSEGDIPDGARYVRLFFGLRGTGTMWVDKVVFRYSKWNFTALERLEPYMGAPLAPIERLIPTPRHAHALRVVPVTASPLIVLPDRPAPAERSAAEALVRAFGRDAQRAVVAPPGTGSAALRDAGLVFALGSNRLLRELKPDLPLTELHGRDQGYVIHPVDRGGCHIVFLAAERPIGVYYAAATAAQLVEGGAYHSAAVTDYPDFRVRAYRLAKWDSLAGLDRDLAGLEAMSGYKLNRVYGGYDGKDPDWYRPERLYRVGMEEVGRRCRSSGTMALGVMVNPYSHFDFMPSAAELTESARAVWSHAGEDSRRRLQSAFRIGLDNGAAAIMLLADDFVPHESRNRFNYTLYTQRDRKQFLNLQNAHAAVLRNLKTWVDRAYPGTSVEFCPPWYANEFIDRAEGRAEPYFRELAELIPREVAIVWTGPTVRSLALDAADLRRFRELTGRPPMFWDNTLYARNIESRVYGGYTTHYPGKVRMCNLFEPLEVDRPPGFERMTDGRLYVNGHADSEIYRIKYATVADWAWNTGAYVPELSLWKALVQAYGAEAAAAALEFSDAYYGLYQVCMRVERGELSAADSAHPAAEWLASMTHSLEALRRLMPEGNRLAEELADFRDRGQIRFEQAAGRTPG